MATTKGPGGAVAATTPQAPGTDTGVVVADPTDPAGGLTAEQQSASAILTNFLDQYGLGSLGSWAWQQYLNGATIEQIMLDMRNRDEYKARFPAMNELAKQGRAISESQYVEYERSAAQLFQQYGLPKGFADEPSDFTAYLTGNVSLTELNERVQGAAKAALTAPKEVRDQLRGLYGVTDDLGALTAMWLDPNRALPLIEQQYTSAQIAAQGKMTGFGQISQTQAEQLASLGVTDQQAQQGFQQLGGLGQVATQTYAGESQVSQQELLDAAFKGDSAAQRKLRERAEGRVATFSGGGGFTSTQGGRTGIGSQQ